MLFLDCYLDGNLALYGVYALPEFLAFDEQNMDSVIGSYPLVFTLFKAR